MEKATELLEIEVCERIRGLSGLDLSTDTGKAKMAEVGTLYRLLSDGNDRLDKTYIEELKANNNKEVELKKIENDLKVKKLQSKTDSDKIELELERVEFEKEKLEHQKELDDQKYEKEMALQEKQLSSENITEKLRFGLGVAELTLPIIFYSIWMVKGLRFEETGTFTSSVFRNLWSRFKPTK